MSTVWLDSQYAVILDVENRTFVELPFLSEHSTVKHGADFTYIAEEVMEYDPVNYTDVYKLRVFSRAGVLLFEQYSGNYQQSHKFHASGRYFIVGDIREGGLDERRQVSSIHDLDTGEDVFNASTSGEYIDYIGSWFPITEEQPPEPFWTSRVRTEEYP